MSDLQLGNPRHLHEAIAAKLHDVSVDDWGIRVKDTPHGAVYVCRMITTWRIQQVRDPENLWTAAHRAWCYPSSDLVGALVRAMMWDGEPDTEPSGWLKSVYDGRRHGEPIDGVRQV